jgi:predicted nicotinamide N-methyase
MSELDLLLGQIKRNYDVEAIPLQIGNKALKLLQFENFEDYLEALIETKTVGIMDLPYWAKVWESSFLLAYFLGKQPVVLGQRMLEIGAGIGVVGIYASLCGHRVTITDINEDALLFARANVLLNSATQAAVEKLDWNDCADIEPYDVIFGSEIVYDRKSYSALVNFLNKALAPKGIIFLAKDATLHAPAFFAELTKLFEFKETTQTVRSDGEARKICLYAIRRKTDRI